MALRIFSLFLALVACAVAGEEVLNQIVVFDAGSSGTRVHIFNLYTDPEKKASTPRVDLAAWSTDKKYKAFPGLSSFEDDLPGAQKQIEGLLALANEQVKEEDRAKTPVMLKATAGLRALEGKKADAILDKVFETFKAAGYMAKKEWVSIIEGKEEGGLAWVAANYLGGHFKDGEKAASEFLSVRALEDGKHTLGIIEMGGGSTQVSFEINEDAKVTKSDEFTFVTGLGKTYRVYAHSYQGYGVNYARKTLKETLPGDKTEDPCYPKDYSRTVKVEDKDVLIKGTGDADKCQADVLHRLFNKELTVAPGNYKEEVPLEHGNYRALKAFFYAQDYYHKDGVDLAGKSPLDEEGFKAANKLACEKKLEEPVEDNSGMKALPKSATYCFAFSYQLELLEKLHAFGEGIEAEIVKTVGEDKKDVEWPLGAAIVLQLEANSKPADSGSDEATSGTGGSDEQTSGTGGSDEATTGTGGSDEQTSGTGGSDEQTTGTGGGDEATTGTGGGDEATTGTGDSDEATTGTGGSDEQTTGTGGGDEATTGTGGSDEQTTGTGGGDEATTGDDDKTKTDGGDDKSKTDEKKAGGGGGSVAVIIIVVVVIVGLAVGGFFWFRGGAGAGGAREVESGYELSTSQAQP